MIYQQFSLCLKKYADFSFESQNDLFDISEIFEKMLTLSSAPYSMQAENDYKGNYSGQASGTRAGKVYDNYDFKLPTMDSRGNSITYKEFDVNPPTSGIGREMHRDLLLAVMGQYTILIVIMVRV